MKDTGKEGLIQGSGRRRLPPDSWISPSPHLSFSNRPASQTPYPPLTPYRTNVCTSSSPCSDTSTQPRSPSHTLAVCGSNT